MTACFSLVVVLFDLNIKCITFQFIFYIDESLTLLDIVAFFVLAYVSRPGSSVLGSLLERKDIVAAGASLCSSFS